jgi:hypothetical protein
MNEFNNYRCCAISTEQNCAIYPGPQSFGVSHFSTPLSCFKPACFKMLLRVLGGNQYGTRPTGMLELAVTASRPRQIPTVFFKKPDDILHFHAENNKLFAGRRGRRCHLTRSDDSGSARGPGGRVKGKGSAQQLLEFVRPAGTYNSQSSAMNSSTVRPVWRMIAERVAIEFLVIRNGGLGGQRLAHDNDVTPS